MWLKSLLNWNDIEMIESLIFTLLFIYYSFTSIHGQFKLETWFTLLIQHSFIMWTIIMFSTLHFIQMWFSGQHFSHLMETTHSWNKQTVLPTMYRVVPKSLLYASCNISIVHFLFTNKLNRVLLLLESSQ